MTTNTPPSLGNLFWDSLRVAAGQTGLVDVHGNATVVQGSAAFDYLDVSMANDTSPDDLLGVSVDPQSSRIRLSDGLNTDSVVSVALDDGSEIAIATIAEAAPSFLRFTFTGDATSALVQDLLHALTYTNTSSDSGHVTSAEIALDLVDTAGQDAIAFADATVAPADMTILTPDTDLFTGTAGDEVFYSFGNGFTAGDRIDGGDGNDTLQLLTSSSTSHYFDISQASQFSGVETIQGSTQDDSIQITGGQLADVTLVDGKEGDNYLWIAGASADLSGKTIANIKEIGLITDGETLTVDSLAKAMLVTGNAALNDTLVLTTEQLTDADRLTLHRQGIDTITAISAETGQVKTTTFQAPQIAALDGDHIVDRGNSPVFIDANLDSAITANDNLGSLDVYAEASYYASGVQLGIDTSGSVRLSNGFHESSLVSVDGTPIGTITTALGYYLAVDFNDDATPGLVQKLVRALTYSDTSAPSDRVWTIDISVGDLGGRYADVQVTVDPNHAPTDIALSAAAVAENAAAGTVVGTLAAVDSDAGDSATYTLLDDAGGRFALQGDTLVVANGAGLDYEQAQAHSITVRATDAGGLSTDKVMTIAVTDVDETPAPPLLDVSLRGTSRADTLVGQEGDDRLVGLAGNDSLYGYGGNDTLYGSAGNDYLKGLNGNDKLWGGLGKDVLTGGKGKDIFVFDTKPNTKTNLDKITDFSVKDDTIWLDNKVFAKLGKGSEAHPGKLNAQFFTIGDHAKDKNDYLIYDAKKGVLWYDADGSGSHKAVEIATLKKGLKMTFHDFFVI